MNESELIDWLCWMWAQDGERFHPPDETAEECMESLPEDRYEGGSLEEAEALGWERGQHARAWSEAVERFRDLERRGFDPVARAQKEHNDLQEKADGEVPDLDWTWYMETIGDGDD